MSVDSLAQALLETGVLDATSVQMRVPRARIGRVFLEEIVADGLLTESSLVSQLARALSVPRFDPKERLPEPEALALLDPRGCEEFSAVPVAVRGGGALLWVAMCDPTDEQAQGEIARRTGRRIKACLIGPRELTRLLAQLAQGGGAQAQQAQAQAQAQSQAAQQAQQAQAAQQAYATQQAQAQQAYANQQAQAAATYRQSVPMPAMQQPMMQPGMPMPGMQVAGTMMQQPGMPQPGYGYPPQQVPSGYGTGFFQPSMPAPAPVPQAQLSQAPAAAPTAAPGARPPDVARLEDELNQARQVVKVLAQLLVERGLIDGDELKRRLRAERDRR